MMQGTPAGVSEKRPSRQRILRSVAIPSRSIYEELVGFAGEARSTGYTCGRNTHGLVTIHTSCSCSPQRGTCATHPHSLYNVISQPTRRLALYITRSSSNITNTVNMAVTPPSESPRKLLWASVYKQLLRHAAPDSRHNYDFLSFVPSFRGADDAVARATSLQCYKEAKTLLVTSDNSLEGLRHQDVDRRHQEQDDEQGLGDPPRIGEEGRLGLLALLLLECLRIAIDQLLVVPHPHE